MAIRNDGKPDPFRAAAVAGAVGTAAAGAGQAPPTPPIMAAYAYGTAPNRHQISTGSAMSREQSQDMIAAAEARTDTKFAQLRGDFALLDQKLDSLKGIKTTVVITGLSVFGALSAVVLGALAFGSAQFSQGLSASSIAHQAAQEAADAVAKQQARPQSAVQAKNLVAGRLPDKQ